MESSSLVVVDVTEELLDLQKIVDAVASDGAGATATFIGTPRSPFLIVFAPL